MFDRGDARSAAKMVASVFVLGALTATGASAQSLADVARHEKTREQTIAVHGRLYTNADLPTPDKSQEATSSPAAPAGATDASSTSATKPADAMGTSADQAKSADADKANAAKADATAGSGAADKGSTHDQAYWQKRMADAVAARDQAQLLVDAMQSRINALTADFASRDDPAQRASIGQDRDRAVTELERLKKELKAAVQGIADLQEEARREGVPPGWLRG